jgi:hypothetical protein
MSGINQAMERSLDFVLNAVDGHLDIIKQGTNETWFSFLRVYSLACHPRPNA